MFEINQYDSKNKNHPKILSFNKTYDYEQKKLLNLIYGQEKSEELNVMHEDIVRWDFYEENPNIIQFLNR